jgi:ATP-binding cassette, subfamily C (CFTR/MRP), member 1
MAPTPTPTPLPTLAPLPLDDDHDAAPRDATTSYTAIQTPRSSAAANNANKTNDANANKTNDANANKTNESNASPLDTANWLSLVTLWWIHPLLARGSRAPLQPDQVWELAQIDQARALQQRFDAAWAREGQRTRPRFGRALWSATQGTMRLAVALYLLSGVFTLVQPLVIKALLQFFQGHANMLGLDSGYALALVLCATSFCGVTATNFGMFLTARAGCNARIVVVDAVFQKVLRLSATARRTMNSGEIVTLASVDAERLLEAYSLGLWAFIAPIMLLVMSVLVGTQMGLVVGLAATATIVVIIYLAVTTSRAVGRYRRRIAALSGERIKVTNEVLQGIRVIKLYGWESSIQDKIQRVRHEEVQLMRQYNYLRLYNGVLMFLAPSIVNAVCFATYVLLGNTLDVATAFVVIALTNACRMPFSTFTNGSVFVAEAVASAARIGDFLVADEVDERTRDDHARMLDAAQEPVIQLQSATFQWVQDAPEPTLRDITFTIVPQSLVVIVGAVGSGKSSLVNALLGEMLQTAGDRTVRGAFSYSSQQPWIQNQTLKENILFGEPLDASHYDAVVRACQLRPDFDMLEQGDATEIGERGINLSGGQKARVGIARAMYRARHCDFLMLDDPLSALDVHVANAVFTDGLEGLAKDKTRILVLNAHYHLLPHADRILVLQNGRIAGDGTLEELQGEFPFLASSPRGQHSDEDEEVMGDDEEEVEGEEVQVRDGGDSEVVVVKKVMKRGASRRVSAAERDDKPEPKKLIVEEDRNVGSVNLQTYVNYLANCGWDGYVVAALIVVLFAFAQLALFFCDWFVSRWSTGKYRASLTEYAAMGIYVGMIVFTSVFAFLRCLYYTETCMRCSANLHAKYIHKVIIAPVTTFFDVTPVGRILNRFSRDLDQVDNPLPYFSMWMLMYFFQICAAFLVCAGTNPYVLIIYLPLAVVFVYVTKYFQASARELKRLDSITRSPFVNLVSETINGIETIRAFRMTAPFSQKCQELLNKNGKLFFSFQTTSRWFAMRTDWLVAFIIGIVAVLAVATRASLGAAVAGLALTYAAQLTSAFQRMTNLVTQTENIMTCFERISYYGGLDEEGHLMKERCVAPDPAWPRTGGVVFENVSMRYRPELELVLKNVSFSVASGEKVGVCGRTGSGKSSVMSILFRVVETSHGRVLIDGVDIATLPIQALRAKLTIIPQDPMLFSGSLRMNLDPFHDKDDAALWHVLKQVHLYDLIQKWGQGLDFEVAEKGENLSVGQRQLLCIARALIRESKVVVMDEATANVDQESDRLIQQTVRESFAGADTTVLCIAHRLETIIHSDKILVLDAGNVLEYDSPSVLMKKQGGIFQSLVESSRAAAVVKASEELIALKTDQL